MAYKIHNPEKLVQELEKMTGKDFADAETQARMEGDRSLDLMISRTFYAVLASKAYKVPLPEIQALPMREYAAITGDVGSFFRAPDAEE